VQIVRSHGLGNDYLVLDGGPAVGPELARSLCDRHRGVGGDGVLEAVHSELADYGLRIWNPDGSTAEKSGNGLRIFARYLVDHCLAPLDFTVEVPGGVVRCTVDGASGDVRVEMGRARGATWTACRGGPGAGRWRCTPPSRGAPTSSSPA
jgi:diaminopimelate epimerase